MFVRDVLLLGAELAFYFGALAGLFSLRKRLGIGLFVTALGTMHFLETYLAASLYVALPGGLSISPGSSVLFSGKLVLLLLVYVKEDAAVARQPIYGLLAGNFLTVGLVFLLRHHDLPSSATRGGADLGFLDQMGWLMLWGTLLLYVDALAIVLVYEKLGRWLRHVVLARIWLSAAIILTLDQIGFFLALRMVVGVPFEVLYGGWLAKMAAALAYSALTALYLRYGEKAPLRRADRRLADVFDVLTYRERYQDLLAQTGRDALTGALDRSRLETQGRQVVDLAVASGRQVSLLVVDVDGFKDVNDRFGHAVGDEALRAVVAILKDQLRSSDHLFRFGGDEFVACCVGLGRDEAEALAYRLESAASALVVPRLEGQLGISVGIATGPEDGTDFEALFGAADRRLYDRKRSRHADGAKRPRRAHHPILEVVCVGRAAPATF